MFLKSIHLKNVKCFSDIALSFEAEDGGIRWYSGVNVKELDTYIGRVAKHLSQTEIPPQTQQRALAFLKALQHYKETVGITASDDTHQDQCRVGGKPHCHVDSLKKPFH